MPRWVDYDEAVIRRRYNRLAPVYRLFEWLFWLPPGLRAAAIRRLELRSGARVLEVGCGTGRNLAMLRRAVGADGHIYGVDLSEGMLTRARALCQRHAWRNVTLLRCAAPAYVLPELVDGVLFSLSYTTMPQHRAVLLHAWDQVRPGGHLVILDARLPAGRAGQLLRPVVTAISRATVLGNPEIRPWEEVAALTDQVEVEEHLLGTYFICHVRKSSLCPSGATQAGGIVVD